MQEEEKETWKTKILTLLQGIWNISKVVLVIAFYISIPIGIWLYFQTYCEKDKINIAEIRFYIVTFLLGVVLTTFGVLRVYNAVVRNTASLSMFSKKLGSFTNEMGKVIQMLNNAVKNQVSEVSIFEKSVKLFTETIKNIFNAGN